MGMSRSRVRNKPSASAVLGALPASTTESMSTTPPAMASADRNRRGASAPRDLGGSV
jgi:hypothetical protein